MLNENLIKFQKLKLKIETEQYQAFSCCCFVQFFRKPNIEFLFLDRNFATLFRMEF